jgi:hypothetical protein
MCEKHLNVPPGWILGQLRESKIYLSTMELWMTCTMSTIRLWRIGDRTIDNILLTGFGLNMMEEFCARRMVERKRVTYFVMQCEMAHEEYKDKREEERARKHKKARRAKEAYARGGEGALIKSKWPHLTQD